MVPASSRLTFQMQLEKNYGEGVVLRFAREFACCFGGGKQEKRDAF